MFCKNVLLVNWGNIPPQDIAFGPINLFSGGNGSGKTTAADALQTLMTAAYENLFTYNPGQDETTQRGRGGKQVRTLASYVLGCDDGSYSRPQTTDGYIAGVFHPTNGEGGQAFTAMIGVRAEIERVGKQRQARQRDLHFFILPGEEITLDMLYANNMVTNLDHVAQDLKNQFGKNRVEIYDKKGLYLNRLYGALRGQSVSVSKRESHHAAKIFSSFMAYKPVRSINDFVAREILEPKDLSNDIKQVSELMKTIHEMEAETRQIKGVVDRLHVINDHAQTYTQHWIDWRVCEYKESVRLSCLAQQHYLLTKQKENETKHLITDTEQHSKRLNNKTRGLHEKLVTLQAKRLGIDALKNKDQLEKQIENNQSRLIEKAQPLLLQDQRLINNHIATKELKDLIRNTDLALELPELEHPDTRRSLNRVIEAGDSSGIDMQTLFTQDMVGIENLEHKLDALREFEHAHQGLHLTLNQRNDGQHNHQRTLRDKAFAIAQTRLAAQTKLAEQTKAKQREVQQLQNQRIAYPPYVETAVTAITHQCPQARPTVLCDFINITDPRWQMAIEGYIGGNRFAVIVEPEFEAEAIKIVRRLTGSGRRNATKIIQGAKVQKDAARLNTSNGSILEVMSFEHKTAEYYIKGSYGNVRRVADENELRSTARGITESGLGSGGYSMFRCDIEEAELVFGQGARERALRAKEDQLQTLQTKRHSAEQAARSANRLVSSIDQIALLQINEIATQMLSLYREVQHFQHQLNSLDLSDFEALEDELSEVTEQYNTLKSEQENAQKTLGELNSKLNNYQSKIQQICDQQESLQAQEDSAETVLESIPAVYPDFDAQDSITQSQAAATAQAKNGDSNDSYVPEQEAHQNQCLKLEHDIDTAVIAHNQVCKQSDSIAYLRATGESVANLHNFERLKHIVLVLKESRIINNRLKNNVLIGKHEMLNDLKESFNTAFVSNLCHSIYSAINDGERTLQTLNQELESHQFGTDRETYKFDKSWVPEFKEYYSFFKEVINLPSLGDGSSLFEAELSNDATKVRDRLLGMLLDNDEHTSLRELKRISDYRNYRDYEIYKTPLGKEKIALSQYGTGSGGQLETPAYIIRSAAITSAFKFNEGDTHCRMVLVDEAFSKMDEARSREVIHYLTEKLGLQLIFIMPTSKSGPFMDLISHQVVFSKCPIDGKVGELNTQVLVDRRVCNKEKIADLWQQHRRTIRNQASLDFMEDFFETDTHAS